MTKPPDLNASNLWSKIRAEAEAIAEREPILKPVVNASVLLQESFTDSLAHILAAKLDQGNENNPGFTELRTLFAACLAENPGIVAAAKKDLLAVIERDPAVTSVSPPLLYFKGYHAIQLHRIAHHLWTEDRKDMALYLQSQSSQHFQVDIHPAARIGTGIMMDHATGVVIGETAVIGNDVSFLHGVTLGGNGKQGHNRHPKVGNGVLLGANATVLGNIEIGDGARVAVGAVVLNHVPPHVTVAGVPACVVGKAGCSKPGTVMDHVFSEPEQPEMQSGTRLGSLAARR